MKYLLFSLLSIFGVIFSSDNVLISDKINNELIFLVAGNTVVGQTFIENGHNFDEIKQYIEDHKQQIDFSYATSGYATRGMVGSYTALQIACALQACSPAVVKLLCNNGAKALKYDGDSAPASHCFICIERLHLQYGQDDPRHQLYCYQLRKLAILKQYADQTLDVGDISKQMRTLRETLTEKQYTQLIQGTSVSL